jgi:hypothetical protein
MIRERFKAQHLGTLPNGQNLVRAVFEFGAMAGGPIHILPAGPHVAARDGREFTVSNPARVIAQTELPLHADRDHEAEREGGSTAATGWVVSLGVDAGYGSRAAGIWGVLEPTPDGLADIKARRFRYISPVLALDSESRDVLSILAVSFTNRPALVLQGIDRDQFSLRTSANNEGHDMTISKTLATVPAPVLRELRARGISDSEIAAAQAYSERRRAEVDPDAGDDERPARGPRREAHRAPPSPAAAGDAAIDQILLSRGASASEVTAARRYLADMRASVRR